MTACRPNCMSELKKVDYPSRETLVQLVGAKIAARRLYGVNELCKYFNAKIPEGQSVHILTGGNCDLLSQLLWVTRVYGRIVNLFIAVWVASAQDLDILEKYIERGVVAPGVKFIFGDIYPRQYKAEFAKVLEMYKSGHIADIYTLNTHLKTMLIECEDGSRLTIESSANLNLNPRIEMAAIHTSPELYDFYDYYLNEILREQRDKYALRKTIKRLIKNEGKTEITDDERAAFIGEDRIF